MTFRVAGRGSSAISSYQGYYGSFYSSVDQADGITPIAMACENTAENAGVTMVDNGSGKNTRITFQYAGTYNIQFSSQFHNVGGGGSGTTANVWFRLNGTDIPNSDTKVTVNSNSPYVVAAWNFIQTVTAGQYIEIIWYVDNASIILEHEESTASHPAIPSVIITAQQVR